MMVFQGNVVSLAKIAEAVGLMAGITPPHSRAGAKLREAEAPFETLVLVRDEQANVYGRELLLPRRRLRAVCLARRLAADTIAAELGLPLNLVQQQMADALLLPEDRPSASDGERPSLDDSQRLAAEADPGPVQVRAGPGTGKTRTLVARTAWLIREKQADPASILALTYSNASADDLSRRLVSSLAPRRPRFGAAPFTPSARNCSASTEIG
jgi:hypothetical protein